MRRYRVEIYVSEGSVKSNEWSLQYKGSPGCLSQLEEVLGESLGCSEDNSPCLMAVHIKTDPVSKVSKHCCWFTVLNLYFHYKTALYW